MHRCGTETNKANLCQETLHQSRLQGADRFRPMLSRVAYTHQQLSASSGLSAWNRLPETHKQDELLCNGPPNSEYVIVVI